MRFIFLEMKQDFEIKEPEWVSIILSLTERKRGRPKKIIEAVKNEDNNNTRDKQQILQDFIKA